MKGVRQRCQEASPKTVAMGPPSAPGGIGGSELHASHPRANSEQERQPNGAVFAGAHVHAERLTTALGVDRGSQDSAKPAGRRGRHSLENAQAC